MKNLIKRYFLAVAPAPFAIGCLLGVGLGMLGGWLLLEFNPAWHTGVVVVPLIVGLALLIGGINELICRRSVSYSRDPVLFFLAKDGKVVLDTDGKVTAGNPLWGKGILIDLPPTDRPHKIRFPRGEFPSWSEPITLEIVFKGVFDPQEVYEKIVAETGYRSFDPWLRRRFLSAVIGSPVQDAFRLIRERTVDEAGKALAGLGFSGGLENIDYIEVTPTVSVTVRFN